MQSDYYCPNCHDNISQYVRSTADTTHRCSMQAKGTRDLSISWGVMRKGKYVRLGWTIDKYSISTKITLGLKAIEI